MLNKGQEYFMKVADSGCNVFLTGGAGVGKTHVLRHFIKRHSDKNIMVCAATGIAATGLDGVTIHKQFDAPIGVIDFNRKQYKSNEELENTDILIVEEISMCRIDLFEYMIYKVFDANKRRRIYGKSPIQIIVSGDFLQLAPVATEFDLIKLNKHYKRDIGAGYAFKSDLWDILDFKVVVLDEVMRQKDLAFLTELNKLREGKLESVGNIFNMSAREYQEGAVTICGTRAEVDEINRKELSKIDNQYIKYYADIKGDILPRDTEGIVDAELELKEGARVMTLVNTEEYKNGSIGTVLACLDTEILVQLDNGPAVFVKKHEWEIYRYRLQEEQLIKEVVGTVEQYPIKLAYAITIHKSQGQTYEAANISPYSWDCGQLYVAISRVKDNNKLYFNYKPDMRYLVVSLSVIEFYNKIMSKARQPVQIKQREERAVSEEQSERMVEQNKILNMLSAI